MSHEQKHFTKGKFPVTERKTHAATCWPIWHNLKLVQSEGVEKDDGIAGKSYCESSPSPTLNSQPIIQQVS